MDVGLFSGPGSKVKPLALQLNFLPRPSGEPTPSARPRLCPSPLRTSGHSPTPAPAPCTPTNSPRDEISTFPSKTKSTVFTVSRPSARVPGNHSGSEGGAGTLLRRYLWHRLKNGFLQFEENVNTKRERGGGGGGEEEEEEAEDPGNVFSPESRRQNQSRRIYTLREVLLTARPLGEFYVVLKCVTRR